MDTETKLPDDVYSTTLRKLTDNAGSATTKGSTIDLTTMLGHTQTWVVRTIRVGTDETVFLQRIGADGGERMILPPEVTSAILRQHDTLGGIIRRRGAATAAAKRKAVKK